MRSLCISCFFALLVSQVHGDVSSLFDEVRTAREASGVLQHVTHELRDRFLLLQQFSNTTLVVRLMDLEHRVTDLQNLDWNLAALAWLHDELESSSSELTALASDAVLATRPLDHQIHALRTSLAGDLTDVAEDAVGLQTALEKLTEAYWSALHRLTSTNDRLGTAVSSLIEDKTGSDAEETQRHLQGVQNMLELERLGLEDTKLRLDESAVQTQTAVLALVHHIAPFVDL